MGKVLPSKKGSKLKFTDEHAHYVLDLAFLNSRMSKKMFSQKIQERKMQPVTISNAKISEISKENSLDTL